MRILTTAQVCDFTNWKVFSTEPGLANTNYTLESFNCVVKRSYTFHVHHALPMLLDLVMDHGSLDDDMPMNIVSKYKCFEVK
jgi:hypothetical protein